MEKLLYVLWRGKADASELTRRFLEDIAPRMRALGAERVQFNIADFTDLSGALVNFTLHSTQPVPDGIVSFWLTSAYRRAPVEQLLAAGFERIAGYAVAESVILPNLLHPSRPGERTFGFSQVTFLQVPPRLSYEAWRQIWFNEHTPVGIETQANFRYAHNVIVMPLTEGAPPFRGIVEECFPPEALRDSQAFYNAAGDEERHQRHIKKMMESCAKFIDFERIDVIATSEYRLHDGHEPAL
ncbi:MAG TPA: EthD domain-containing protein [Steroidobacteraceae bacterium]|nr:EthD domain-containing protein [Steroidobacteraceae bacterium]